MLSIPTATGPSRVAATLPVIGPLSGRSSSWLSWGPIRLTSESRTENLDGGGFGLWPTNRPVTAVTSVTDSQSGDGVDSGDWSLVDDAIYLDTGRRWDEDPPGRWTVVYTGGWETVPKRVEGILYDLLYRIYQGISGQFRDSTIFG